MSDPDPSLPPAETPAPSRISDRAALEAALAGAAGLLLGRVLLGRGAGLLAGTAAIAARLLTDVASKKPAEVKVPGETASSPPVVPAEPEPPAPEAAAPLPLPIGEPPTGALAAKETLAAPAVLTGSLPPPAPAEADVIFGFGDPSEAVEIVEVGEVTAVTEPPASLGEMALTALPEGSPDIFPPAFDPPDPTDESPFLVEVFPDGLPLPPGERFANLFTEAIPSSDLPSPTPATGETAEPEPSLPEAPAAALESGGTWQDASPWLPLPAFPTLTEIPASEIPLAESAPDETPAAPPLAKPDATPADLDLPGFPAIAADLPHPDEIWKMAAEESAPVPLPASATTPVSPPAATLSSDLPVPPPATPLAAPLSLFEAGQENPFTALLNAAAPTSPSARETITAPVPPPEADPLFGFPDVAPYHPTVGTPAAPEVESAPVPLPDPAPVRPAEPNLTPPEIKEPPAEAIAPLAPEPLPVISLKAEPVPEAPLPVHAPPDLTETVIPAPAETTTAAAKGAAPDLPPPAATPTAPRTARKAWAILLLLAALLTWLYRQEMKKTAAPPSTLPAATQSAAPAKPASTPVVTPPPVPPAPTPQPSPPVPSNPAPKPPDPALPDNKAAMVRPVPAVPAPPVPAPPAPAPPPEDPVIYAEPPPGVPQDFPPGSLEGKARQTLEKLLTAKALPEIAPLVHDPAASLKQAAKWFPDGNPKPVSWKRIIFDSSDQMPRSAFKASLFRVVTDQVPMGFPVAVEETRNGPRIDFTAYVQCRDRLLDAFMAKPDSPPQPFLVLMRRGHYFGDDLSAAELEQLICFEIAAPNPGSPKHRVFIQRGSDLGRLAVRRFVWDKSYTPVVELTRTGKHVEITAIVRDVWRIPSP